MLTAAAAATAAGAGAAARGSFMLASGLPQVPGQHVGLCVCVCVCVPDTQVERLLDGVDVALYILDYTKLKTQDEAGMFERLRQVNPELVRRLSQRLFFVVNKVRRVVIADASWYRNVHGAEFDGGASKVAPPSILWSVTLRVSVYICMCACVCMLAFVPVCKPRLHQYGYRVHESVCERCMCVCHRACVLPHRLTLPRCQRVRT